LPAWVIRSSAASTTFASSSNPASAMSMNSSSRAVAHVEEMTLHLLDQLTFRSIGLRGA